MKLMIILMKRKKKEKRISMKKIMIIEKKLEGQVKKNIKIMRM